MADNLADIVIRGGMVVDGSGAEPVAADVAITDGLIVAVGQGLGPAREEVDATGCFVTPGFVDIHTHYDGQAIWSNRMDPSSNHGVSTVVMGNCGVGFAPCRTQDHDLLIKVMEGVEDIPGVVMAEGLSWDWETFPQYLDALDAKPRDIDVAAYLPHSPLRVYVMGQRGADREPATEQDLATMRRMAKEAVEAGALGCATSRVYVHRTADGKYIPSYQSSEDELQALADGMAEAGGGVMQMVGNSGEDGWESDIRMMKDIGLKSGRPFTFTLGAAVDAAYVTKQIADANAAGSKLTGQIYPRPIGMIMAHNLSWNPFTFCPSFAPLAGLSDAERVAELRKPEVRAKLLSEEPDLQHPLSLRTRNFDRIFPLGNPPNYEPNPDQCLEATAAREGVTPLEWSYDYLLGDNGKAQLLVALGNFVNGSLDMLREMMDDPNLIFGLGDGGAHYGLICDASYPTYVMSHWVRNRGRGLLPIGQAVATLTRRPAETVGLYDRGLLAPGYKADINVIDPETLSLHAPTVARDLPGGGRRLMQTASGYKVAIVSGEITYRNGEPTGELPGKLVRGAKEAPVAA